MPRRIHFVESGLAKVVKKVVNNVFILVRELRNELRKDDFRKLLNFFS